MEPDRENDPHLNKNFRLTKPQAPTAKDRARGGNLENNQ